MHFLWIRYLCGYFQPFLFAYLKRILTIWILWQSIISVPAQEVHHAISNYSISDGIPQSQVSIILEDHLGYLWIGTQGGGLARFDGQKFDVFTTLDGLYSNVISNLWFDSRDNLWILHPRGITKFDGATFCKIRAPSQAGTRQRILTLFEESNTVYSITYSGHIGIIASDSIHYSEESIFGQLKIRQYYKSPQDDIFLYLTDGKIYSVLQKKMPILQNFIEDNNIKTNHQMFVVFDTYDVAKNKVKYSPTRS